MGYHFREQDSFVRIVELTPVMRKQIEATIEHLLSVLDHFDGDENLEENGDLEPTLGAPERHPSSWEFAPFGVVCRESGPLRHVREKSQDGWADGLRGDHEREEENEHGGDILDEPHDGDDDYEPCHRDL
ncbi:MAG: hypothetical protein ACK4ZU_08305 [Allorhizobium sp.]